MSSRTYFLSYMLQRARGHLILIMMEIVFIEGVSDVQRDCMVVWQLLCSLFLHVFNAWLIYNSNKACQYHDTIIHIAILLNKQLVYTTECWYFWIFFNAIIKSSRRALFVTWVNYIWKGWSYGRNKRLCKRMWN